MLTMEIRHLILTTAILAMLIACSDDDSFTQSPTHLLTFSEDSVKLDTVFSNVPTVTRDLWVYNHSGNGIRCTNIRLERGNQSGFRVNVDGSYLGAATGFQTSNVELRNKDSLRIFVEATTPYNNNIEPQLVEDNLIFTLESGVIQKVNLNAYSWDAVILKNMKISSDSTLDFGKRPVVIYGGITVDSTATLTIAAGTTIYFHANAGIEVYGRLLSLGEPSKEVVLRGDRIDRMFPYLPYDRISGQWQGIRLHSSSYGNVLQYTDLHSPFDGIAADSSAIDCPKLNMLCSTIHNCQGYGIRATNCQISLTNCQITNTLRDCILVDGGKADINACTIAQFYSFDYNAGVALHFRASTYPLVEFNCKNTLITGTAEDQFLAEYTDTTSIFNFDFAHCIIRTPAIETADSVHFYNVIFEDIEDTLASGRKHFVNIDNYNRIYDFRLDSVSTAIGQANTATSPTNDRSGRLRDDKPDVGAYEYLKE